MTIGQRVRKGKTKYETMLQQLFWEIDVYPQMDMYVCLRCGLAYELQDSTRYPTACKKCGDFKKDNRYLQGMYMMPDLMIGKIVIFVNGPIHTKHKQAKKDEHQIRQLLKLGYIVYVFENDDVYELTQQKKFIVHAMLRYISLAILQNSLYFDLFIHEKEMTGVKLINDCIRISKNT
ncbi:hypothetical protein [Serratia sp. (in: enterobacteria)]|uniref:hypothetical protein n=1 Tax=Serratia sp. (in: enterobacteria) TaxID=616 RepID=UPI00398952AC